MKREVDFETISDGRYYDMNDMVKADCGGCMGCHTCCTGMGSSVILTPYDVCRLTNGLGKTFEELIGNYIELNMYEGVILPNLAMHGDEEACMFLDRDGRCTIHEIRPDICRLFPLGRIYNEDGFRYFLQIHECTKKNRSKVKVKNWINIPDPAHYDKMILAWHDFLCYVKKRILQMSDEDIKKTDMFILQQFYLEKYTEEDFYGQFYIRLAKAKEIIGKLHKEPEM